MAEKHKVGEVFTYLPKVGVAGVKLTEGSLDVGDMISIKGHTTDFEQTVESIEIDREAIKKADVGQEIGIKVKDRVRPNDIVYKLVE